MTSHTLYMHANLFMSYCINTASRKRKEDGSFVWYYFSFVKGEQVLLLIMD